MVEVEVTTQRGIPGLVIVGLPSHHLEESRERITAALSNSGIRIKALRTVVNLAPADQPKSGSSLELAMAVGLLLQYGTIKNHLSQSLVLGELSLDGNLKALPRVSQLIQAARDQNIQRVILPTANLPDCQDFADLKVIPLLSIAQLWRTSWSQLETVIPKTAAKTRAKSQVDLAQIRGMSTAKRAVEIAAAGHHHLLMCGPPGGGKSLLAAALAELLPPLNERQLQSVRQLAVTANTNAPPTDRPPFRRPHHSIGLAGMLGGGYPVKPGEVTLADRGVLFLDELSEFQREVIEGLREPLETGCISLSRRGENRQWPARFQLVAATNPCSCGFLNSTRHHCRCSVSQRRQHWRRLSGPLLDRIDLFVWIDDLESELLNQPHSSAESSSQVSQRVTQAIHFGQQLPTKDQKPNPQHLEPKVHTLLSQAAETLALSNRGILRTLQVARTIANLELAVDIGADHLAEALSFRSAAILPDPALLH